MKSLADFRYDALRCGRLLERMPRLKSGDENHERDGTDEEDCVAGNSHPTQRLHQLGLHEFTAASVPVTGLDRGLGL